MLRRRWRRVLWAGQIAQLGWTTEIDYGKGEKGDGSRQFV
jgi:hypothetical protein